MGRYEDQNPSVAPLAGGFRSQPSGVRREDLSLLDEGDAASPLAWRPQLVERILSRGPLSALDEFSCILDLLTISCCF